MFNRHAYSTVLMAWSSSDNVNRKEAQKHFEEAMSVLETVAIETGWEDRYTLHLMLNGIINYSRRWGLATSEEMKRLFDRVYRPASKLGGFDELWRQWAYLHV